MPADMPARKLTDAFRPQDLEAGPADAPTPRWEPLLHAAMTALRDGRNPTGAEAAALWIAVSLTMDPGARPWRDLGDCVDEDGRPVCPACGRHDGLRARDYVLDDRGLYAWELPPGPEWTFYGRAPGDSYNTWMACGDCGYEWQVPNGVGLDFQ